VIYFVTEEGMKRKYAESRAMFGVLEFETRRISLVIAPCCLAIGFPCTSVSKQEQLLVSYYERKTCFAKKAFISVESTAFAFLGH
jgi:hypothetical protein